MVTFGIPQHPVATTDKSFSELGLSKPIVDSITRVGFVHPTPIQAAVIAIALQTKAFLDLFGADHQLSTACLIGGVKMTPQIKALRATPDVIVATPGRLLDHVRQRNVKLDAIEQLVLDEADHMLDLGFLPQVRDLLRLLPRDRHTMMFSATMPDSIEM